jgi:hypothetical protein
MDFFSMVKLLGDSIAWFIGVCAGICAIIPSAAERIQKWVGEVKDMPKYRRWGIGTLLIGFATLWFLACVKIETRRARENSPVYQKQIEAKHALDIVAQQFRQIEKKCLTNATGASVDAFRIATFGPTVSTAIDKANSEGLNTVALQTILGRIQTSQNPADKLELYRDVITETEKLSTEISQAMTLK